VPEVPVQPLLPQHCNECGQQGHQQTRIYKDRGRDDLRGGTIPRLGSGGVFVGNDGPVESEEDCAKVGLRPFTGIWLKLRLNVYDESRASRREQAGLRMWLTLYGDDRNAETHKNQGGVEVLVVLLHRFCVVLHGFTLVHGVEIELRVVVLDRLEVHS
jgi:hypothetical protein